jgi:hypothetical protein
MSELIDTSELKKIAYEVNKEILNGPNILPYLLAGGAGALVGGAATAIQPRGKDESRLRRLYRVLRNATLLGGVVGGGSALIGNAVKTVDTALPAEDKVLTEGIGEMLGSKDAWRAGLGLSTAGTLYAKGRSADQQGLGRYLKSVMGEAYGDNPSHEYADYNSRVRGGSDDTLKAQHPHKRWADHITATSDRNKLNASYTTTDATGAATRHVPTQDPEEVTSKLRRHGYSPEEHRQAPKLLKDLLPGDPDLVNKLNRGGRTIKDLSHMHLGRIVGRTNAAKAIRIPALAASYFAPDVASYVADNYNSGDESMYE